MNDAMQQKQIVGAVIAVILVGGLGFYSGIQYGRKNMSAVRMGFGNVTFGDRQGISGGGNTRGGMGGMFNRGGITAGEILSKNDSSITLKLGDSGSRIIFFSTTTAVTKSVQGSVSDLSVGGFVSITGTPNQDGSISAQSIQIRPASPTGIQGGSGDRKAQ